MSDRLTALHFVQWNTHFPNLQCTETRSIHLGEGIWALQSENNPNKDWQENKEKTTR